MELKLTWEQLKQFNIKRKLGYQFLEEEFIYNIWLLENGHTYYSIVRKTNPENEAQLDFENNYKEKANKPTYVVNEEGKQIVRAESRPLDCTTVFTSRGDSEEQIGEGKILTWDFSDNEDIITLPSGSTVKRKRIEFKFLDSIYIKEGTLYFHNALKGSYVDIYVVCPQGAYYLDNNGVPKQAVEDTKIAHYVINQFFQGTCPMGDEFNTEACSILLPSYLKYWLEITVPLADNQSNGYVSLELYRKRTVIL